MSAADKLSLPETVSFSNITTTSSSQGSYLRIEIADGSVLQKSAFGNRFGTYESLKNEEKCYWVKEISGPREGTNNTLLYYLFPPTNAGTAVSTIYIGTKGTNFDNCGWQTVPCATLDHALSKFASNTSFTILSPAKVTQSHLAATITRKATVTGELSGTTPQTKPEISDKVFTTKSGADLTVTQMDVELNSGTFLANSDGGKAALTSITFTPVGTSAVLATSSDSGSSLILTSVTVSTSTGRTEALISVTGGTATLDGTKLWHITGSASVLAFSGSSLEIKGNSEFKNITKTSGNGAVLEYASGSATITVASTTFDACVASGGNGGALALTLGTAGKLTIGSKSGSAITTVFKGCQAGSGKQGGALWISCGTPGNVIINDGIKFEATGTGSKQASGSPKYLYYKYPTSDKARDWSTDKAKINASDSEYPLPSCFGISNNGAETAPMFPPDTYYVDKDSNGNTKESCILQTGCNSLEYAIWNVHNWGGSTVQIVNGKNISLAQTNGYSITKAMTLKGTAMNSGKVTMDSQGGTITVQSNTLTVSSLTVQLTTTTAISKSLFIVGSSGTLAISSVEISDASSPKNGVNAHLIDSSAGILKLTSVTFTGIKLVQHPLLHVNLASEKTTFSETNTFDSIESDGNGAVLSESITSSHGLKLENMKFINCKSKMGAMHFTISGSDVTSAHLSIAESVQFYSSGSTEMSWGKPPAQASCAIGFTAENYANIVGQGKILASGDVTIDASNKYYATIPATNGQTAQLAHFGHHPSEDQGMTTIEVKKVPSDWATCGWSDLPCLTIKKAIEQANKNERLESVTLYDEDHEAEESTISVPKDITLTGTARDTTSKLVQSIASGNGFITSGNSLTLEKMTFKLDTASPIACPVIYMTAGTLTMSDLAFESSSTATVSLTKPIIQITVTSAASISYASSVDFTRIGTDINGAYIYMKIADGSTLDKSKFGGRFGTFSTEVNKTTVYWVEETGDEHENQNTTAMHFFYPPSSDSGTTAYVTTGGADIASCGWTDLPCLTAYSANEHIRSKDMYTISLKNGEHGPETSSVAFASGKTVTLSGEGKDTTKKTVASIANADGIITSAATQLTVSALTFNLATDANKITCPLMLVTAGTLSMENVGINAGASLTLTTPIIQVTMADANSISLTDSVTFSSNIAKTLEGGYVYMKIADGTALDKSKFGTRFTSFSSAASRTTVYWVEETGAAHKNQKAAAMHFFYAPKEDSNVNAIQVKEVGADIGTCGWKDLPCLTIAKAMTQTNGDARLVSVTLSEETHSAESAAITTPKAITLQGGGVDKTTKTVIGVATEQGFITSGYDLTVQNIKFSLAATGDDKVACSVLYLTTGKLDVSNVAFEATASASFDKPIIYAKLSSYDKLSLADTVTFNDNIKTDTTKGSYLYIEIEKGETLTKEQFGTRFNNYDTVKAAPKAYWVKETGAPRATQDTTLLHFLFHPVTDDSLSTVHAGPKGTDFANCGWEDVPCATTLKARDQVNSKETFTISLQTDTHAVETSTIAFTEGKTVSLTGAGTSSTTKPVNKIQGSTGIITSAATKLSVSSLTFTINPDSLISSPLLFVTAGTLILNAVDFQSSTTATLSPTVPIVSLTMASESSLSLTEPVTFTRIGTNCNGAYIYMKTPDGTKLTKDQFGTRFNGYASSDDKVNAYWVEETGDGHNKQKAPAMHFFYPPSYGSDSKVYVDTTGADIDSCGWEDIPCLTITKAQTQAKMDARLVTITVSDDTHEPEASVTMTKNLTVNGGKKKVSSLKSGEGQFIVSTAGLTVTFSSMTLLTTENPTQKPLFYGTAGSLTLSEVTIHPEAEEQTIFSLNAPLIHIGEGMTTKMKVHVERVTYSAGNGSAIHATLNDQSSFTIEEGSSFTSCTAQNGGAIYLTLTAEPQKLELPELDFQSCAVSPSSGKGAGICIVGNELARFVADPVPGWLSSLIPTGQHTTFEEKEDVYYGIVRSETEDLYQFSLVHLQYAPSVWSRTDGHVARTVNGVAQYIEIATCGWSDVPCKTIKEAQAHIKTDGTEYSLTLSAGEHSHETASVSFESGKTVTVSGESKDTTKKSVSNIVGATRIFTSAAAQLNVKKLTFVLDTDTNKIACPLLDVTAGALSLDEVEFTAEASLSLDYPLIQIDMASENSLSLTETVVFTKIDASKEGAYISMMVPDGTKLTQTQFGNRFVDYDSSDEIVKAYWVEETDPEERKAQSAPVIHFFYAPEKDEMIQTVEVKTSGADIGTCGWEDLPCLTIKKAMTQANQDVHLTSVTLSDETHAAETASIAVPKAITLKGTGSNTKKSVSKLDAEANGFIMSAYDLSVEDMTFSLTSDDNRITCSVLYQEGGKLTATNVGFEADSSVSFSKPIIYIKMSASDSLSLPESVSFTNIETDSTKGSYLHIEIEDGSVLTDALFGTRFSKYDDVEGTPKAYWVKETFDPRATQDTTLLHFLFHPITNGGLPTVYVGTRGSDFVNCGWEDVPCDTLSHALTHHSTQTSFTIQKTDGVTHSHLTATITAGITVQGAGTSNSDITKATLSGSSVVLITTSASLVTIQLFDCTVNSGTFLKNEGEGGTTIDSCKFTGADSAASLFSSSAGTLTLTKVTVASTQSSKSLIDLAGGDLTINGGSSFKSITKTEVNGNGAVLEYTTGTGTISITETTFDGCVASGNGGALAVTLTEGTLTIGSKDNSNKINTIFKDCEASKGGALWISCGTPDNIIIQEGIKFETANIGTMQASSSSNYLCHDYTGGTVKSWNKVRSYIKPPTDSDYLDAGSFSMVNGSVEIPMFSSSKYYVDGASGISTPELCMAPSRCNSLTVALTDLKNWGGSTIEIVEDKSISLESSEYSITESMTFQGTQMEKGTITTISSSQSLKIAPQYPAITFTLTKLTVKLMTEDSTIATPFLSINEPIGKAEANVEIISVKFTDDSTSKKGVSSNLIDSSNGYLKLKDVTFTGIAMGNEPLLHVNLGEKMIEFEGTNAFESITSTGNGAVLHESIKTNSAMLLNNMQFTGCSSALGVLCFDISSGVRKENLNLDEIITDKKEVFFTDTSIKQDWTETGPNQCAIGFESSNWTNIVGDVLVLTAEKVSDDPSAKYYAKITAGSPVIGQLAHFASSPDGNTLYVSAELGGDQLRYPHCGWKDFMCTTVAGAIASSALNDKTGETPSEDDSKAAKKIVVMKADGTTDSTIGVKGIKVKLTVTGEDLKEDGMIRTSVEVKDNVYIVSEGGELTVEKMSVEMMGNALDSTFVETDSGAKSITLNTMEFTGSEKGRFVEMIGCKSGTLTLTNVTFTTFKSDSSLIDFTGSSLAIEESKFIEIENTASSGAVFSGTVGERKSISVSNTEFRGCQSSKGVGLMCVTVQEGAAAESLTLTNVNYDAEADNTESISYWSSRSAVNCAVALKVDSVSLRNQQFKTNIKDIFSDYSTNVNKYFAVVDKREPIQLYYYLVEPSKEATVYVDADKGVKISEYPTCGWSALPCSAVEEAKTIAIKDIDTRTIEVKKADKTSASTIGVNDVTGQLTVAGEALIGDTIQTDVSASESVYSVANGGKLTVKFMSVSVSESTTVFVETSVIAGSVLSAPVVTLDTMSFTGTASEERSVELLKIPVGQLTLTKVSFSTFKSKTSLVTFTGSELNVEKGCRFEAIENVESNGGAFSITTESDSSIIITKSNFKNCKTSGEGSVGGAIYIDATNQQTNLELTDLVLTECTSKSQFGGKIYIICREPSKFLTKEGMFAGTLEGYAASEENHYWVKEPEDTNTQISASILHILYPPVEGERHTFYVAANGVDSEQCGWENATCRTVEHALNVITIESGDTIALYDGEHAAETNPVLFSGARVVTLTGTSTAETKKMVSQLNPVPEAIITVKEKTSLTITTLTFILDSETEKIITCPLICVSSGTLAMSEVVIESVGETDLELSSPVIDITMGTPAALSLADTVEFKKISITKEGAYVDIKIADGTTLEKSAFGTRFDSYSDEENMLNPYYVHEQEPTLLERKPQKAPAMYFFYPPKTDEQIQIIEVNNEGADISTCGWEDLPCLTLAQAMNQVPLDTREVTLNIGGRDHKPETTTITVPKALEITGAGITSTVKTVSRVGGLPRGLITSEHSLTLQKMAFQFTTNEGSIANCPLLFITDGKLSLTEVNFESDTGAVVSLSSPIISIAMESLDSLSISDSVTFKDIDSQKEGAYVDIEIADATELTNAIVGTHFDSYNSLKDASDAYWVSKSRAHEKVGGISLLHYIFTPAQDSSLNTVYIWENGVNSPSCGWEDLRCTNLETAKAHFETAITMDVTRNGTIGSAFTINQPEKMIIESVADAPGFVTVSPSIIVTNGISSVIDNKVDLTIRNVIFICPSSIKEISTVIESSKVLDLETVGFRAEGDSALGYGLLTISEGTFSATDLNVSSVSFGESAHPIQVHTEAELVSIKQSSFSDINLHSSLIEVVGEASSQDQSAHKLSLAIEGTTFSDITVDRSSTASSVITSNTDVPVDLSISSTNFTNCTSPGCQEGGAIHFNLVSEGHFTLENVKAENCSCSGESDSGSTENRGGFLYLDASSIEMSDEDGANPLLPLSIQNFTHKDNKAGEGNSMYIVGQDLSKQLDHTIIDGLSSEDDKGEFVGGSKDESGSGPQDFGQYTRGYYNSTMYVSSKDGHRTELNCGTEDMPCSLLNSAISHIPDATDCTLLVNDKVEIAGGLVLEKVIVRSASSSERAKVLPVISSGLSNNGEASSFISVATNVTFDRIHFVLIDAFAEGFNAVMSLMDEAYLTVTDCEFCSSDKETMSVDAPLFRVASNSELTLKKMSVAAVTLPSAISSLIDTALLGTSPAKVIIESSSFTNIEHKGDTPAILSSSSSLGVTIKDSEFKGISSSRESGAVLTLSGEPILSNSTFDGTSKYSDGFSQKSNTDAQLCLWSSSLLHLDSAKTIIEGCKFENASNGVILIDGQSNVTLDGAGFSNNNPNISGYPTMRRNGMCKSGELTITSAVNLEGEVESDSLWIATEAGCTANSVNIPLFFKPTVEKINVELDESNIPSKIVFTGMNLIPCNLTYVLEFEGGMDDARNIKAGDNHTYVYSELSFLEGQAISSQNTINVKLLYFESSGVQGAINGTIEKNSSWSVDRDRISQSAASSSQAAQSPVNIIFIAVAGVSIATLLLVLICCFCSRKHQTVYKEEPLPEKEDEQMKDDLDDDNGDDQINVDGDEEVENASRNWESLQIQYEDTKKTVKKGRSMKKEEEEEREESSRDEERVTQNQNTSDQVSEEQMHGVRVVQPVLKLQSITLDGEHDPSINTSDNMLYYQLHTDKIRTSHNPISYGAELAYYCIDAAEYLLNIIYSDDPQLPDGYPSVEDLEYIVDTFSPYSILTPSDGTTYVALVPPKTPVPSSPKDNSPVVPFEEAIRRYQHPLLSSSSGPVSRKVREANVIHSILNVMLEIATGWQVFEGYSPEQAAEMIRSGLVPDFTGVASLSKRFTTLLSDGYTSSFMRLDPNMTDLKIQTLDDLRSRLAEFLPPHLQVMSNRQEESEQTSSMEESSEAPLE